MVQTACGATNGTAVITLELQQLQMSGKKTRKVGHRATVESKELIKMEKIMKYEKMEQKGEQQTKP